MKFAKLHTNGRVQSGSFSQLRPTTSAPHEVSFAESEGFSIVQSMRPFDPSYQALRPAGRFKP